MKDPIRRVVWLFYFILFLIGIYLIVVIIIGTVTDFKPDKIATIEVAGNKEPKKIADSILTFISWNIGYCGLGAEMDFFYDNGKMVRPTSEQVKKYTSGVLDFLKSADTVDFFFLQEVDKNSSRTDKQDETTLISNLLENYFSSFGTNYKVQYVPVPLLDPLGKIEMGQMIFSKYKPEISRRYSYSPAYAWPKKLFMPDRCYTVSRFNMENGKEFITINTHNSAYDEGGKLRRIEMPLIRNLMMSEYRKGNYVIAGGDWNQNPPGFKAENIKSDYKAVSGIEMNRQLFPENWQFAFDAEHPTNREIDTPLAKGKTNVTIIDFYILSPNIELEKIQVYSQNFQNSDHEPVFMKIKIR